MIEIRRSGKSSLSFGYKKTELANGMLAISARLCRGGTIGGGIKNVSHSSRTAQHLHPVVFGPFLSPLNA